jgi:hypothetical protein
MQKQCICEYWQPSYCQLLLERTRRAESSGVFDLVSTGGTRRAHVPFQNLISTQIRTHTHEGSQSHELLQEPK